MGAASVENWIRRLEESFHWPRRQRRPAENDDQDPNPAPSNGHRWLRISVALVAAEHARRGRTIHVSACSYG